MTFNPALTQVDTRDAVYTIEHVAALFHVKVDSAREYTYRQDFPPAHQLGARLLWDRDEMVGRLLRLSLLPHPVSRTVTGRIGTEPAVRRTIGNRVNQRRR
jgi:hypothetical protein